MPDERTPALKRALSLTPLQRGDLCTYLAHPDWGSGLIRDVLGDGRLLVSFEIPGEGVYEDSFHPQELELATPARVTA